MKETIAGIIVLVVTCVFAWLLYGARRELRTTQNMADRFSLVLTCLTAMLMVVGLILIGVGVLLPGELPSSAGEGSGFAYQCVALGSLCVIACLPLFVLTMLFDGGLRLKRLVGKAIGRAQQTS